MAFGLLCQQRTMNPLGKVLSSRLCLAVAVAAMAAPAGGCAGAGGSSGSGNAKYPRRSPGCELATFYTPVPGVVAWDDLGIAEVGCHVSTSIAECLNSLKAEACRMGGDIMYNIPRKPLRPRDQLMVFRAQVGHTKAGAPKKASDPDMPPPASPAESAGPVVPLGAAADPTSPQGSSPGAAATGSNPGTPDATDEDTRETSGDNAGRSDTDSGSDDSSDGQ
jgi:hypothetical protein